MILLSGEKIYLFRFLVVFGDFAVLVGRDYTLFSDIR